MADTDQTLKLIFSSIKSERDKLFSSLVVVDELISLVSDASFNGGSDLKLTFIELLSKFCSSADQLHKNFFPECRRVLELVCANGNVNSASLAPQTTPELPASRSLPVKGDSNVPVVSPVPPKCPDAAVPSCSSPVRLTATTTTCVPVQNVPSAAMLSCQSTAVNSPFVDTCLPVSKPVVPMFLPTVSPAAFPGAGVPPMYQPPMNPSAPAFFPLQTQMATTAFHVPFPALQPRVQQQTFSGFVPTASTTPLLPASHRLPMDPVVVPPPITHPQLPPVCSYKPVATSHHIPPPMPAPSVPCLQPSAPVLNSASLTTASTSISDPTSLVFPTANTAAPPSHPTTVTLSAVIPPVSPIYSSPTAVQVSSPVSVPLSVTGSSRPPTEWSSALSYQLKEEPRTPSPHHLQISNQPSQELGQDSCTAADQLLQMTSLSATSSTPARNTSSRASALMAKCSAKMAPLDAAAPGAGRTLAPQPSVETPIFSA